MRPHLKLINYGKTKVDLTKVEYTVRTNDAHFALVEYGILESM